MRRYISSKVKKLWASLALLSIELIIVLLLFLASVIAFAFLVNRIFRLRQEDFDHSVFRFLDRFVTDTNTELMSFITFFATHTFLIPANLILIAYFLFVRRHRWYSIKVPVVALGSVTMMSLLKLFFSRPRPLGPILEEVRGFSFPSGHAMSSMTFYGLLIYLVWQNVKTLWLRWTLVVILSIIIFLIGFSRIYLRVHYTSDVIAGFSIGIIWLVISIFVMNRIETFTRKEIAPQVSANPNI